MKNLILIVFLSVLFGCGATQKFQPTTESNVVQVTGNKDQLYNKARQWFSEYFVSGESVIDYEDKEAGAIIGNGITNIGTDTFGIISHSIEYTIRVDTKDNRMKVDITINNHQNFDSTNGYYDVVAITEERQQKAIAAIKRVENSLVNYVKTQSDW